MSILSDLFVADPADALRYETEAVRAHERPSWVRGRARFTGLINLHYEVLWAAVDGRPWQPDSHSLEEISMRKDGGAWLFRFPHPLSQHWRASMPASSTRWPTDGSRAGNCTAP